MDVNHCTACTHQSHIHTRSQGCAIEPVCSFWLAIPKLHAPWSIPLSSLSVTLQQSRHTQTYPIGCAMHSPSFQFCIVLLTKTTLVLNQQYLRRKRPIRQQRARPSIEKSMRKILKECAAICRLSRGAVQWMPLRPSIFVAVVCPKGKRSMHTFDITGLPRKVVRGNLVELSNCYQLCLLIRSTALALH